MDYYSRQITKLIEELSALPGVGRKSAQRLAFHIISMPEERVKALTDAMTGAKQNIRYCRECQTLTDDELCPICKSTARDHRQIMVVENTRDLAAYEKTGKYNGVYHVLHGAISPMLGIGPGDIRLKELVKRLEGDVDEVIIATNSSLEGETTAMYISKLIKPTGILTSRRAKRPAEETPQSKNIEVGGLRMDCESRRVYVNGKEVYLTAKEFDVLELLVFNPNKVYSRENLLNIVWGYEYPGDVRTVDVHIRRLREKIEENPSDPKYVHTKWGVGYYFQS